MIQENQKGFTLVELLVTVGIIGILATITVASLSGTRTRARDAQRISDAKQLAAVLDAEFSSNPGDETGTALEGCTTAGKQLSSGCTGPGDSIKDAFSKFKDPKAGLAACGTVTVAASTAAAQCGYTIASASGAGAPKTGDYQLCFVLENDGQGTYKKGMNSIRSGTSGAPAQGCL